MAKIRFIRSKEYINMFRKYKIYIDGNEVGTISNGETKEFDVSNGNHELFAKIDWCSSQTINYTANKTDEINEFSISGFKNSKWIMSIGLLFILLNLFIFNFFEYEILFYLSLIPFIFLIYYLSIGRNKYLTLKEL